MGMNVSGTEAATNGAAPASDGATVKYRLVEAEEVDANDQKPMQHQQPAKTKKKGKVNWTQFPLGGEETTSRSSWDEASSEIRTTRSFRGGRGGRGGNGGRFGGRGGRGSGRRLHYDDNGVYYNGVYVPNPDLSVTAQWAKNQIEFYFSPDNLVRDIFLRQHMDVDGYVPLAFVGSFQAVFSVHQDYDSLLDAMKHSETVELDEVNEKIRLRHGWEKWVWPNAEGGYGVARYIKVAETEQEQAEPSA